MSKLPFDRTIFWKVFLIVMALVVLTFFILFKFSSYQLTNADRFGSLLSATIFSYLVHLWLLPPEYDDEDYEDGFRFHHLLRNCANAQPDQAVKII